MIGLGLPLALITGWLVAQSLNQDPKANQQINHQLQSRFKPVEHPHKTKDPQTIEPEQKLEQLALSRPRKWRWRLLLAQMKLQRGDRNGPGRELITLQALWPNRSEVQNLQLMLDMGTKRQANALEQTSDRFKQALDQLAVRWQLDSFRKGEDRTPTRRATVLPPPPKERVETIPKP